MLLTFQAVVLVLVVARITRLVAADQITYRLRQALVRRLPDDSPAAYLVFCRWCLSIWVGLLAATLWWSFSPLPRWSGYWAVDVPTLALALSYAAGVLVRAEPQA